MTRRRCSRCDEVFTFDPWSGDYDVCDDCDREEHEVEGTMNEPKNESVIELAHARISDKLFRLADAAQALGEERFPVFARAAVEAVHHDLTGGIEMTGAWIAEVDRMLDDALRMVSATRAA
jgi:hypothetical protein